MLQTDNKNATPSIPTLLCQSTGGKQADIVKRLEELTKWQEEQKKILEVRQTMQRQMLGMEQKSLYQMLGLQSEDDLSELEESKQDIRKVTDNKGVHKQQWENTSYAEDYEEFEEHTEINMDNEQINEDQDDGCEQKSAEPCSYKTVTSGYATEEGLEVPAARKPKRPFLKRGQGLRQRFKIDPDELKLNNLPRYKYANAHPKLRLQTRSKPLVKSNKMPRPPSPTTAELDVQEQRFQQLLISSKNVCNSTPDNKSSLMTSHKSVNVSGDSSTATSSSLPKVRFVETSLAKAKNGQDYPPSEGPSPTAHALTTVAWSKILDPQQIQPLVVPRKSNSPAFPQSEEDIFELLEQKANNGSFDMNSTCIKQFLQRRITEKLNDTDVIPINDQLKTKRLQPLVVNTRQHEVLSVSLEETQEESELITEDNTEADEEPTQKTMESTNSSYPAARTTENRVRFSDSHDTHEYHEEETITDSSQLTNTAEGGHTSNEFFEQFKQALFAALQVKADHHSDTINSMSDTTLTAKDSYLTYPVDSQTARASLELEEKTNMIKMRLLELEKEIATFKENNVQLMKAKQEHELEKSLHAQEQLEAAERLKDEKIQIEIYLHDERMKLEEEKRKFEQQLKSKAQMTTSKERKEVEKLREQVAQLEMQLKNKDCNHASAQARWRTQQRSMEREEKRLHEQIEMLSKENKRLENEMLKVSRENNNKMLQEINRNIAKLAPKQNTQHASSPFPDDDLPPVLPSAKTLSKTIVATAAANKNTKPASKSFPSTTQSKNKKTAKNINSRSLKPVHNPLPETPSSDEAESTPDTSFIENSQKAKKNQQQRSKTENLSSDEDEDDILKELQASAGRNRKNKPTGAYNSAGDKSPKSSTNKVPPAASPTNNMKRELTNADGSKDIWYPNGNLKKISADGMLIRMLYYNKDIKETNINEGTVKYYYAETNTWHTTYLDGLEILEFPNGQIEHRHKNGVVEVHYPNNSVKIMDPREEKKLEEWRFPDGTHLVQMRNGDKILSLPNGQKEIHTKLQKRREYPDGTVKIVYPDGSTETRYSNGRVRLKDKDGNLVMDTEDGN